MDVMKAVLVAKNEFEGNEKSKLKKIQGCFVHEDFELSWNIGHGSFQNVPKAENLRLGTCWL